MASLLLALCILYECRVDVNACVYMCVCQLVSMSHYTETCECMRVYVCVSQLVSMSHCIETCECMRVYACSVSLSVCPTALRHVNACVYMRVRSVCQCVPLH